MTFMLAMSRLATEEVNVKISNGVRSSDIRLRLYTVEKVDRAERFAQTITKAATKTS